MNADLPHSVGHGHRFVEIEPSPATPSVTCPQGAELRFRGLHRQARVRGYQVRPAARLSSEGAAISTPQLDHLSSIYCRSGDVPRSNSPGGLAGKYSSCWPGHLRRRGLAGSRLPKIVRSYGCGVFDAAPSATAWACGWGDQQCCDLPDHDRKLQLQEERLGPTKTQTDAFVARKQSAV